MQRFHPGHKFSAKERTADVRTEEQVDFESLLLSPLILKGLADSGFEKPSPIQLKAIPLGRCGLDLIAQAKSGTGKTCVFSVIALENVLFENPATQVLILAPTREIAVQIKDVVNAIGCHLKGLSCQAFIGGLPLDDDKKALKRCHIAVGSPGRVKNLIEKKYLKTDSIRMFILDEADKLLDENFQEQINWIFSTLPGNKQMMAFSATYPEYLANHLTRYMREPTFVRLNAADPTLQGIKQFYHVVPFYALPHKIFQQKVEHLLRLLSKVNFHQCLLFSNFQIRAQSLSSTLCAKGWPATFIAGSQTQEKRLQAMEKLKAFQCRILISTDLTARGIDAENVNLVVNMDVPWDGETYLHRIGRAGRFGTKGVAITFVAKGKEEEKLREIEKSIGITMEPLPDHIPDSFMISDSLTGGNQGQAKQDTVVVNVLHKNMTATTDKDESSRSLISNGKGNVSNGLNQAENHTEHKKVDLGATFDYRDTFVYENGTLSSEVATHNSNEHSHEQVIKSGLKKNDASGKQEKSSELPSLEEFEKDFEEYLAMASTFEDLGLQDKGEGCQRKQTNCNDQVKETDDHKNKLTNSYDGIDEGADKNKLNTDKSSQKLYGISLTSKDTARVNGGVDDLKKDKGENIEDKIENDRDDSSDDEDEEDDDGDYVEDDDDDEEEDEEEEDDGENDDDNDNNDNEDDDDDNYEEQDEKEEDKTDQNLKCELMNDQSNNSNVLLQIYKKDKNYNDTKTTDEDGHCDSGQQPSVDNEDKYDENATDDDDNENDGDEYHDENNVVADDNDDVDESDEDGGDSDEDGDGDVNKSGGSKDNNNQEYDINYYYYNNDVGNLQCESSTNHERYETFDGKQGHGTSQGIESCTAPCHDKSSITGHQCNGAYPADSHGNSMEYCPSAYMYHRTRLMSDYATSEGSGRSGMLSYCMTQGHHALHQGSQYLWNNMGNVGYQPSVDNECSSMYANMINQHRETSWSNAWHNAYYQVNNAIQQFAAMNSRIS